MIIPVEVAIAEGSERKLPPQFAQFGTEEVVLVELQGALDVEGSMNGQFVGKLSVDDETVRVTRLSRSYRTSQAILVLQKKPSLLIGHHLLEGKLANLPKPLAIMHRVPSESEDDDTTSIDESVSHRPPPTWKIRAVVKRKMVFAKRPMPMVGNANTSTGPTTIPSI